jgi:cysteine dioxygenase
LDKTSTLAHLLRVLPECSGQEYIEIVKNLHLTQAQVAEHTQWLDERYTRILLSKSDKHELILLCWEEGQDTAIHCHNSQECWVYAVEGSFDEKRYRLNNDTRDMVLEDSMELDRGKYSHMNDDMGYHSLRNTNKGRTISLHLYVSPIDKCQVYEPIGKSLSWKALHYDNAMASNK